LIHGALHRPNPALKFAPFGRCRGSIGSGLANRRHRRVGHLFQGRFKAILVDHDAYLLELSRYIVLNPVRAGMAKAPADWRWSSYRASAGLEPVAPWLAVDGVLSQFAKRRSLAQQRYAQFVSEGIKADSPWQNLKGQVFLGDDLFVQQMQAKIENGQRNDVQIPIAQRRSRPLSLPEMARGAADRNVAIVTAYATGAYSYQEIATHFGLHFTTVGRIVRRGE
jgi:putative transposase